MSSIPLPKHLKKCSKFDKALKKRFSQIRAFFKIGFGVNSQTPYGLQLTSLKA